MPEQTKTKTEKSVVTSLTDLAERRLLKNLTDEIQKESQQSIFAVGGSLQVSTENTAGSGVDDGQLHPECKPITLRWDSNSASGSSHKITLPCSEQDLPAFEQLVKDCQPASFGRGAEEVLDESYRKAGKIDETCFSTNLNPYELGIIDTAAQILTLGSTSGGQGYGIRAELYKLNVYSAPSGKFKAHVDTPRSGEQVGSLVICLPSVHQGGQLVLRHEGQEKVFDWSGENNASSIHWAAFFSDCEHEVMEVTEGHRLTLTFNLYAIPALSNLQIDLQDSKVNDLISNLLIQPGFCRKGRKLGFYCTHAYPHTEESTIPAFPTILKGVDKLVYDCFSGTGHQVTLQHRLNFEKGYWEDPLIELLDSVYHQSWDKVDEEQLKELREHYQEIEIERYGRKRKTWQRRDSEDKANADLTVMSKGLKPFVTTDYCFGEDGGSTIGMLAAWDEKFTVERIHWLNAPSHEQHALVTAAYGNSPSINVCYANMAIVLHIPPVAERMEDV